MLACLAQLQLQLGGAPSKKTCQAHVSKKNELLLRTEIPHAKLLGDKRFAGAQ